MMFLAVVTGMVIVPVATAGATIFLLRTLDHQMNLFDRWENEP